LSQKTERIIIPRQVIKILKEKNMRFIIRQMKETVERARTIAAFAMAALLALFLGGCSDSGSYLLESCVNPLKPVEFIQPDGYRSLAYNFKIGNRQPDTVLFFIGGSGCHSLKYYLRQYLDGLSGNIAVFALQKRAVGDRMTGIFGCPPGFWKSDYFDQWLSDQSAFIARTLNAIQPAPKRAAIASVSEGAMTAAAIAAANKNITHLVIIGAGGMKQIDELRLLTSNNESPGDIEVKYREIGADPGNTEKTLYDHSFKYWSSVLAVDPLLYFEKIEVPVIIGFGEADTSVPVESTLLLKERMRSMGKTNVNLIIYPGADHALKAGKHNYRKAFFQAVSKWLRQPAASSAIR